MNKCPKCSVAAFCLYCSTISQHKEKEDKIEKLELIYDAEIGAYRIPMIVDRSKFQVLNAYVKIIRYE